MSYDVSKLTNLGQLKSALQRVNTVVSSAKASRSIVTIARTDWSSYDNLYRSNSIITPQNYHYYDIHLTSDTSNTISIMCANADIRAKNESGSIYLYCYGTLPTQSFSVEIVDTPIKENVVGLSYDIGDDFLVYPSITDGLNSRLTTVENSLGASNDTSSLTGTTAWSRINALKDGLGTYNGGYAKGDASSDTAWQAAKYGVSSVEHIAGILGFTITTNGNSMTFSDSSVLTDISNHIIAASNVSVGTSKWTSSGDSAYPYKAVLNVPNVTAEYVPLVQFSDADVRAYNFSSKVTPGAGNITIYCKTTPSSAITVESILCLKCKTVTVS